MMMPSLTLDESPSVDIDRVMLPIPLRLMPPQELAHGGNAGLDKPVSWLEPVHTKHPDVSYADLYTLAGKREGGKEDEGMRR